MSLQSRSGLAGGGGVPASVIDRIVILEDNEIKVAYFAEISSGTSGTVAIPTGATILLDQLPGALDAIVSTMSGASGQPTGATPLTAGGVAVSVSSFDASGNYTLSGTPSAYPVALIYVLKIDAKDWSNLTTAKILEYEKGPFGTTTGTYAEGQYATDTRVIRLTTKTQTESLHTGDTNNTKVFGGLIPANTITVGDWAMLTVFNPKSGTANTATCRVYFNNTNDLTTPTLEATLTITATSTFAKINREYFVRSATETIGYSASSSSLNDSVNSGNGFTIANVDWTIDQYLVVAIQLVNGADSSGIAGVSLNLRR